MQYDMVIVGSGMVGASLAAALQESNLRIALLDATPHASAEDPRLIALSHGSYCFFKNIGVWPLLAPHATAIKQIHVSHRAHFGITRIHARELDLDALGYLVPAKFINAALEEKLKRHSAVTVMRPATLTTLTQQDNAVTLAVNTPTGIQHLQSRLVIGADGTHSTVRELLGIATTIDDYQQSAIVTMTELKRDHRHIAYERFLQQGAIAMLPLTEQRCATIWTAPNPMVEELMRLSDHDFLNELQTMFGYRLGRLQKIHKRYTYPLKLVQAAEYQQHNVILIGNAAHTLHPIASQGLNLALHEVAEIATHFSHGDFSPLIMQKKSQQKTSIQLSHQLTHIFSTDFFAFNLARQLGMVGLDTVTKAKKFFMHKAMGKTGTIPHLLREKDYHESHGY